MILLNYILGFYFSPFVNSFSAPYCIPEKIANKFFKNIGMRITEKHLRMKDQKKDKET